MDSDRDVVARCVPDAVTPYFEVYDEDGGAQIVQVDATDGITATCDLELTGDTELTGDLEVTGDVDVTGDVEVTGDTYSDTYTGASAQFAVDAVLADADADVWHGDATAAPITLTLPLAADADGRTITVKKVDAGVNAVNVSPSAPETFDGVAPWILANQFESVTLRSDGADWHVVQSYPAATVLRDIVPTTPVGYPYVVLPADQTIFAVEHAGAGDNVIALPPATGSGREITVVCIGIDGAGTLLIDPDLAEQINALGAGVVFAELDSLMDSVTLKDYAAGQWFVVSRSIV
jgi:hypothetical protein